MEQFALPNRASRGSRINKLLGEEAEADEAFWNHEVWNEDEDEDYSSEAEEEDVVDSDFDEDENPDEDVHDGDAELKRAGRAKAKSQQEPKSQRKPPARTNAPPRDRAPPKPRAAMAAPSDGAPAVVVPMAVRSTTVQKRFLSHELQQKYTEEARSMQEKTTKPIVRMTQRQLLEEAVQTEVENTTSLNRLERLEEEKRMIDEIMPKAKFTGPVVRYHSAIGKPKLISFLNVDSFPAVFKRPKVSHAGQ
ncbi:Aste57867_5211 [Aphanomyces stellatus]|uniref:Aste57867_5211 protein n=1 Tax=Aphanomyces stellatus TaxID=120398 RepID=A0A485KDY4_9STRA|nr:hypothetical protein As57867_005198 [Aphanomyces stellatus]VFT82284.1 Aste57867_5211 [Aphanomyces stellatus]